jgi:hypothetical protein
LTYPAEKVEAKELRKLIQQELPALVGKVAGFKSTFRIMVLTPQHKLF